MKGLTAFVPALSVSVRALGSASRSSLGVGLSIVSRCPAARQAKCVTVACATPSSTSPKDDDEAGAPAGPAPAPTAPGVSTAGLPPAEAALLEACYKADVRAIEDALDGGASATARDINRRSALHFCAGNGLGVLVKRLLDAGAEINGQDILGLTPLHMATGYKKMDTVRALVEAGADANIACYGGELPVELAERLFAATPEKKFLRRNPDHRALEEIIQTLDPVTELEEGEEDESSNEEETESVTPASDAVAAVQTSEESSSEGGAKFVVRRKERQGTNDSATPPPPQAEAATESASDVKVTVRTKKSDAGDASAGSAQPETPVISPDAKVVIRRKGEQTASDSTQ